MESGYAKGCLEKSRQSKLLKNSFRKKGSSIFFSLFSLSVGSGLLLLANIALAGGVTLHVGPERTLKQPSDAAKIAREGDVIEIDAGEYNNDYVTWYQHKLLIRGAGGMAHLKSTGFIPNGKAIWVVVGDDIRIENIEFSGASVADTNGAGIRHEGGDLTLHNTFFHDNEFSILTGKQEGSSLVVSSSRFWFQRRPEKYSHGLYIGTLDKFTITGSHIKGTHRGHQIKSRARENHILYNRIEDVAEGNSSRLIDLPNCGLSIVLGNDLHQAASTQNVDAIGFGAEGCDGRSKRELQLHVANNTFLNEASSGTLVKNHAGAHVLVANNLLLGRGFFLLGKGLNENNVRESLSRQKTKDWHPRRGSKAVDASHHLPPVEGILLVPTKTFQSPVGSIPRQPSGRLDIGARELIAGT